VSEVGFILFFHTFTPALGSVQLPVEGKICRRGQGDRSVKLTTNTHLFVKLTMCESLNVLLRGIKFN